MKDLRAERSIRKQPRVTYEMAPRAKTPTGGGGGREILTRKAPAWHGELRVPTTPCECSALTHTRPWLQSCSHTVCSALYKTSRKLIYWSLFFSKKHGEAWEGAQPKPAMPTNPSTHTHTCAQLSVVSLALGICKAQVWFGGCCDGSEDSCSQWADPMTKRKKRRQTQVFNETVINDFPGRTQALAQREEQSWNTFWTGEIYLEHQTLKRAAK